MPFDSNYITIDNPNIAPKSDDSVPLGEMITVLSSKTNEEFDQSIGVVDLKDMYLPQVTVRSIHGQLHHDALFVNTNSEGSHLVASCFIVEGNIASSLKASINQDRIITRSGQQNLKYDPQNEYVHASPRNTVFEILHFSLLPEFVMGLLPEGESWSENLKEQVYNRERIFSKTPPVISATQYMAIHNILNNPLKGKLGILMMETSIIQLMLLQLHAQFNVSLELSSNFSKRDLEIINGVKEYLTQTFLDDHSLHELARHFATNTNKLMTLFKKAFNTSIFEYIRDLKMDYAKRLLVDEGQFVSEVSSKVGYKNPHHFSAAFKKRHGICPSSLKAA